MPRFHAKICLESESQNWTLEWQKLYQKVIPNIVAANALALSRLVTHNNPIFSIKTTLCETSNIRFKNEC